MLGIGGHLWRLTVANPILLRVVESAGKRPRDAFIRSAYLAILISLVCFLLLGSAGSMANARLAELSRTSQSIFYYMSYVQLMLVCLLAPVFTAGAITQEKDSQTYDILLATPLTNAQIVFGSLFSRLFFVISLLISGIPVFAITQIFGGVAIRSIVLSVLIAAATAFATGALAMAIAVFKVGTRRTIFSFYLFIMIYLAVPLAIESLGFLQYRWNLDSTGRANSHISLLAGVHPFLALRVLFGDPAYRPPEPGMLQGYAWPWTWYLSSPHTFYITLMTVLSVVLVAPSTVLLRRLAQSTVTLRTWLLKKLRLSTGDRTRRPRRVWANPIAWREAKTKASANRAVILRYGFMLAGIAAAVALLSMSRMREEGGDYIGISYLYKDSTLTIVRNGRPEVFKLAPGAALTLNGDSIDTTLVREGMACRTIGLAAAGGNTIKSLDLAYPAMMIADQTARQFLLGLIMVEIAVILLILTQAAASTVTREKEDGTLDLLLSTPITSRYYIWGKLRGLVIFVAPLLAVPLASIVLFLLADALSYRPWLGEEVNRWTVYPESLFVLPATLVMVSAFAAIVGMHMSLRCRKTVMAVMSSVGIVGGVCGALWMCGSGAASSSGLDELGALLGAFSPFTLLSLMIDPMGTAGNNWSSNAAEAVDARIGIFIAGWIAASAYALAVWSMYKSMVHNFDMTIRKQG